jgi:hypothetical protein
MVRTIDKKKPFKETVLEVCAAREDMEAAEVTVRINGALSDLHSAEARYHDDCRKTFMGSRNVHLVSSKHNDNSIESDEGFKSTCKLMIDFPERMWTSVELHNAYAKGGGNRLSRKQLVTKIKEHFGEKVLILTSPGIASIVVFRAQASSVLNVVKDDDGDEVTKT